jgi:hypothetical protein
MEADSFEVAVPESEKQEHLEFQFNNNIILMIVNKQLNAY